MDGLRAIAVLPVVLFHASPRLASGGFVGVDVFFVISGYLITGIIAREVEQGRFSILRFYERRVRRIFPNLLAMLVAVSIAGYFLFLPQELHDFGDSLKATMLFLSNIFFYKTAAYFDGASELKPLLHTWSLSVEEQFYILFPPFLMVVFRFFRGRFVAFTWPLVLLSLGLSAWGLIDHPKASFYLAPTRANELLLGGLVALGAFPKLRAQRLRDGLSLLGLALILWSSFTYTERLPFPGLNALVPCLGAALIIHAGADGPSAAGRLLGTKPLVFVGLISYALYLWHWPVLVFAKYRAIRPLTSGELQAALLLAFALSVITWRYVERPFRQRDAVLRRPALFAAAGAAMAGFVALGLVLGRSQGLPGRFDPRLAGLVAFKLENQVTCGSHPAAPVGSGSSCVMGSAQAPALDFAVWGDSHSLSFFAPVDAVARERGRAGLFFGQPGCPPVVGIRKVMLGEGRAANESCTTHNEETLAYLTRTPAIRDVLLIARWPYYSTGEGYGVDRSRQVRLFERDRDRPLPERELEEHIAGTISALLAAGKRVHFVETVPEFGYSAPDAYGRVLLYGGDPTMLDEAVSSVDRRQTLVAWVAARFAGRPGFSFVPTHDLFCTAGVCRFHAEGKPLYSDNNHIGGYANPRVMQRLAREF